MVLSNIDGIPCLQIRVGNADATKNRLTDVEARLTVAYVITYNENGKEHNLAQFRELKLMSSKRNELAEVWTLYHVIDRDSPLFGLAFTVYPGSTIMHFQVRITCVSEITQSAVSDQTTFQTEDILIGHRFVDQIQWDKDTRVLSCDYTKMNETEAHPVWYPTSRKAL